MTRDGGAPPPADTRKLVEVNAQSTTQRTPLIVSALLGFGPTLLIVWLFVLIGRWAAKSGGGMGALSSFGRSKARRFDPDTIRVTFADVAGIDEAKSELTEIVDFLRSPERYGRLGGRMPHGVRAEILDSALLRPGRFDRRVAVQPPDRQGRRQILEVHTRSIPLADSVDLESLAATTPGMVGADLANLANEAALVAARRNHHAVQTSDFTDSLEKILLGAPRGIVLSAADRERTAYHEAGHALVGMLTAGADPVRKVSIIPRGAELGVTLSTPDDDQVSYTREDLLGKIKVALGGRVAEETVFGTITTGAESDIDPVTAIARQMVGRWGMSKAIGFVRVLPADGRGPFPGGAGETSESTQRVLDRRCAGWSTPPRAR